MSRVLVKHNSRLSDLVGYRLRVLTQDGRVYIGELMAFDKHMNLILSDCVEERIPKQQQLKLNGKDANKDAQVEKRTLGLVILRGEHVLTTIVQDKPLLTKKERIVKSKKEDKQLKKQQNKNKSKNGRGKITKPSGDNTINKPDGGFQQAKQFQPPPGFKRR